MKNSLLSLCDEPLDEFELLSKMELNHLVIHNNSVYGLYSEDCDNCIGLVFKLTDTSLMLITKCGDYRIRVMNNTHDVFKDIEQLKCCGCVCKEIINHISGAIVIEYCLN